jgi:hypothetical protein
MTPCWHHLALKAAGWMRGFKGLPGVGVHIQEEVREDFNMQAGLQGV